VKIEYIDGLGRVVGVERGGEGFDGRRWLLFLALALFLSQLGTNLGDS
jgi:hypothetical protein